MSTSSSPEEIDVIISGYPDNDELIRYIADGVAETGLKVWFSKKQDTKTDVSQLIPQTKVYVPVLCENGLRQADLKDDIALAYITNTAIFPVATRSFRKLDHLMDGGMKLMLSRIQWTFFIKEPMFQETRTKLLACICEQVGRPRSVMMADDEDDDNRTSTEGGAPPNMISGHLEAIRQADEEEGVTPLEADDGGKGGFVGDFWERHLVGLQQVSFATFRDKFNADYSKRISETFGPDKKKLFENLLLKDVFCLNPVLDYDKYEQLIGGRQGDPDAFYIQLSTYVSGHLAVREVLDTESTVRMTAIQQLATFKTPPVIRHLKELTTDPDPNIQAVSALALAKSGVHVQDSSIEELLIGMLSNDDRLVRESACLSLAHMKSAKAVWPILNLWRNDPIKHVREAAELALSRLGLDESRQAMKITKILTEEVAALKEASQKSSKT